MTDITATKIDDYAVDIPFDGGMKDELARFTAADISVEGAWLVQSLEDLVESGEYKGVTMTAAEAILLVADKIEQNGVAPEAWKATADLLRYLSQFALHRPIPMG
jgi:hypothetical protein